MKHSKKKTGSSKTRNYMGAPAYDLNTREKLLNLVATCLMNEPKYYGKTGNIEKEILKLCKKDKSEYILKLALYARKELHLRSTPIYLLAIAANIPETKQYVRAYAPLIIQRADELYEVFACYKNQFGKPFPNSLKKGVADAFMNFDEYQYGKYNRATDFTYKDVIRITHVSQPSILIDKIMNDNLATPETWETRLSAEGNKAAVWDDMLRKKKLPYMAMLRNLRNMSKAGITRWDNVIDYLTNRKAIAGCKQLPHRFLSAYEALGDKAVAKDIVFERPDGGDAPGALRDALNVAMRIAAEENIPKLPGKTAVICDNSGSARGDYGGPSKPSSKSIRSMADIGNLLGLLTWYTSDNVYFAVFGDKLTRVELDREVGILDNFAAVDKAGKRVGQSTEQGVFTFLEKAIKEKTKMDRLVVCSDLQIGDGKDQEYGVHGRYGSSVTVPKLVAEYRKKVNPNFMYYSVCFNGYGNDVIVGDKKVLISGFSDNILRFISAYEQTGKTQVKHIMETYNGKENGNNTRNG